LRKPSRSFILIVVKRFYWILTLLLFSSLLLPGCGGTPETGSGPRAAIVDQLYLREPNTDFIAGAARLRESAGFKVEIWQGEQITVDFYRKLPSMGYRFILLRVHSGTLLELKDNEAVELPYTYLFTAEKYSSTKYVRDQLSDTVGYAIMDENSPEVFAVNSEFIRKSAKGSFDHTLILSMGCESSRHDDLEKAFTGKGASAYIGWSDIVSLEHVDKVTLRLLENFCTSNMTLEQGVSGVMQELGADPYFGSVLKFYPPETAAKTVKELTE
jgi:hypothetical protein